MEYILSDKTGTLTQNKMVAKFYQVLNNKIPLSGEFQLDPWSSKGSYVISDDMNLKTESDEMTMRTNNSTFRPYEPLTL